MIALVLSLVVPALAAEAQEPDCSARQQGGPGGQWFVTCSVPGTSESSYSAASGGSLDEIAYAYREAFMTDANGDFCWRVIAVAHHVDDAPPDDTFESPSAVGSAMLERWFQNQPMQLRCPDDPYRARDPQQVAADYWSAMGAGPDPVVTVSPEVRSVVGLPTFVMLDPYQPAGDVDANPDTVTWQFDSPAGVIGLRATPSHHVDWDDAAWDAAVNEGHGADRRYEGRGRDFVQGDQFGPPYDGTEPIAHVYQVTQAASITVEVQWTGEWRVAGGPWAPIAGPPLVSSATVARDVVEFQAVVTD